jgi:hypothetical protein
MPTHRVALLRRPGTDNTKADEPRPCHVIERRGTVYDISEFDDLFDLYGGRPLLTRRETLKKTNGHDKDTSAREFKPPINIEARLAAMTFEGPGDSAVHPTQLSVAASLLRNGVTLEETTRTVLEATRTAVANDPTWNWQHEELAILRMGADFIVKNPELAVLLPDKWRGPFEAALAEGRRPDVGLNKFGFYVRGWRTAAPSSERDRNQSRTANAGETQPQAAPQPAPQTQPQAEQQEPKAPNGDTPRKYRFRLVSFADVRPGPEPLYLIDELIPVAGLVDV